MDILTFWLPLALLFLSALIGAVVKRRSCDHCLKKFEGNLVLLPIRSGEWAQGRLLFLPKELNWRSIKVRPLMQEALMQESCIR